MAGAAKFLIGCAEVGEGTRGGGSGLVGLSIGDSLVGLAGWRGLGEAQERMYRKIGADFLLVVVGLGEVGVGLNQVFNLGANSLVNNDGEFGKVAGVEVERRVEGASEELRNDRVKQTEQVEALVGGRKAARGGGIEGEVLVVEAHGQVAGGDGRPAEAGPEVFVEVSEASTTAGGGGFLSGC